ncbi:histidine kinase dimerization/phospho-acceptor domain-containing protein [Bacteroides fragilis]
MSHEIRTPLNAIVGFPVCWLLRMMIRKKDVSGYCSGNNDRLLQIVTDVLDLSK